MNAATLNAPMSVKTVTGSSDNSSQPATTGPIK